MLKRTDRFRRADRILRSAEFRHILGAGERVTSRNFVVFKLNTHGARLEEVRVRLGITVSRRVGNAVVRNQLKRRLREWFRGARHQLSSLSEIVVIARSGASGLDQNELRADLDQLVKSG